MDDNIALLLLASCRTRHIRAKWFRRVPRLCVCLHKQQYANGRLLLQALCSFHQLVESYRDFWACNVVLFSRLVHLLVPFAFLPPTLRRGRQKCRLMPYLRTLLIRISQPEKHRLTKGSAYERNTHRKLKRETSRHADCRISSQSSQL